MKEESSREFVKDWESTSKLSDFFRFCAKQRNENFPRRWKEFERPVPLPPRAEQVQYLNLLLTVILYFK